MSHVLVCCRVAAGGTTPIKDQGACGSCVAFATVALAEFMHMRKYGTTNATTDLSEQVSNCAIAHDWKPYAPCTSTALLMLLAALLMQQSLPLTFRSS